MVDFGFRVADADAGARIDKVVARQLPEHGRRATTALFEAGRVLVEGRVAKKGDRAVAGASVVVRLDERPVEPELDLPLDVILERPDIVVVRKPAGRPTAPLKGGETGTLANAIVARYPETEGIGYRPREPGLLHRLDTQTSGLVVVARTADVFTRLRRALSEGRLAKRYLAVVSTGSLPASGVIEESLAPDQKNPRRVRVVPAMAEGARPATTRFRAVAVSRVFTLLEVDVSHAYRHQVRVHLAHVGAAIVGDAIYGGASVTSLGERHALHASYVAWTGDDVVPGFAVRDPLPAELEALLSD